MNKSRKYILNKLKKQKKIIKILLKKGRVKESIALIDSTSKLLYKFNCEFYDSGYESLIHDISVALKINPFKNKTQYEADDEVVIFYDMFGFDERGLAHIYLKALLKFKKVIYITKDNAIGKQPKLLKMLNDANAVVKYISWDSYDTLGKINDVNSLIKKYRPSSFFIYTWPFDIDGNILLHAYKGYINRYLINLTDHAFWLGADCCDVSIEFRDFGYWISNNYRNIDSSRQAIIRSYPIIDKSIKGIELPSLCKGKKFFFSGGSLYKTISKDNKYYILVDRILSENKELVFWYCGSGEDGEIKKLINKYPDRVVHTAFQDNVYQIIAKSEFFLSTYPLMGGLMFQYAALAGKIPLTLKSGVMANDFLKNHESLNYEFETIEDICKEVKKILNDKNYALAKRDQLIKSVPMEQEFYDNLYNLVEKDIKIPASGNKYKNYDFDIYHKWYLEKFDKQLLEPLLVGKITLPYCLFYFPIKSIKYFIKKLLPH